MKSAAEWFSASGTLKVDEGRTLDLKQLFALLDASPGSRFLELGDGEFIALTASFRRHLDDLRGLSSPAARGSVRMHTMAALALRDFAERTTLIQNNLMDLYSLFGFLNPGMLGSTERYRRHFAGPVERDGDAAARARLRRLVAPFVLRRLKTEVLDDLPPRTEIVLHVDLSPAEAALYEALRWRAVEDLEAMMIRGGGADSGVDSGVRPGAGSGMGAGDGRSVELDCCCASTRRRAGGRM